MRSRNDGGIIRQLGLIVCAPLVGGTGLGKFLCSVELLVSTRPEIVVSVVDAWGDTHLLNR